MIPSWPLRVDALLKQKDRNWAWLGKKVGKDKASLSRLKNGKGRLKMNPKLRASISVALEVPEELIFGKDTPNG